MSQHSRSELQSALWLHLSQHHGVVTRSELIEIGFSRSAISRRVQAGELIRMHPSVYLHASKDRSWHSRARAAACGARGLLSHRSALHLWGIDSVPKAKIEVVVPYGKFAQLVDVRIHRTKQPGLTSPTTIDGIEVTGLARSVLDTAAVVGPRRLDHVVDAALRSKLVIWEDLYEVLIQHSARGRDGCGHLRALLDERFGHQAIPDSAWNRMVGRLLEAAGLPQPSYEYEVRDSTGLVARVDLAYPAHKLAIELDSVRWHHNRSSFVADPRRRNRLLLARWRVLSFTWSDYAEDPSALVSTIRDALHET